jgi:hypothetical protein
MNNWIQSLRSGEAGIEAFMAALESVLISIVGRVGLWLTPLPSAFLVSRSASRVFDLTGAWPIIMAAIVELVGLACSHLWLTAREWNTNKNKTDPEANERLAFTLMLAYFGVTGSLLLAFELPVVIATGNVTGLTALLFPVLSAVAVVALNERAMQHKRLSDKRQAKLSRKRKDGRKADAGEPSSKPSNNANSNAKLNASRQEKRKERLNALALFYADNPNAGPTEAGRQIGVSRQTVYAYLDELEAAGVIHRNGSGIVEVVR